MIRDRNLARKRKLYRIPYQNFAHEVIGPTTAGKFATTKGTANLSNEISTFGYAGLSITSSSRFMATLDLVLPTLMNPEHELGVRVLWTTNGTVAATDTVTWTPKYSQTDVGEALTVGTGSDLDTVIVAANPSTTTLLLRRSSRGKINANTFDWAGRAGVITWNIEIATGGFSANEVVFLALEIDYMPKTLKDENEGFETFGTDLGEVD